MKKIQYKLYMYHLPPKNSRILHVHVGHVNVYLKVYKSMYLLHVNDLVHITIFVTCHFDML